MRHLLVLLTAVVLTGNAPAATFRVEIDYMDGGSTGHSHEPSSSVIQAVQQMFACHGHTLIVDV
ncbi:MAG: hypothetical protein ACKVXR_14150, partial [Planctomycetota bacterium]